MLQVKPRAVREVPRFGERASLHNAVYEPGARHCPGTVNCLGPNRPRQLAATGFGQSAGAGVGG
jgi:hypothetical protein